MRKVGAKSDGTRFFYRIYTRADLRLIGTSIVHRLLTFRSASSHIVTHEDSSKEINILQNAQCKDMRAAIAEIAAYDSGLECVFRCIFNVVLLMKAFEQIGHGWARDR